MYNLTDLCFLYSTVGELKCFFFLSVSQIFCKQKMIPKSNFTMKNK